MQVLGPDTEAGHKRQMVVPGGYFKAGQLYGTFCLIGIQKILTVASGHLTSLLSEHSLFI